MNSDKNDVALDQAPATVDGKTVLSVLQITISDIPSEDGYKVLLKDASSAVIALDDFKPGAAITTDDAPALPADEITPVPVEIYAPAAPAPTILDQNNNHGAY